MEKSDWFTVVATVIALGIGMYMSTYRKALIRRSGMSLMAVGVIGLFFWFGFYRNAGAQVPPTFPTVSGNCNNFGNNNFNCNTFNVGPPQRRLGPNLVVGISNALAATKVTGSVAVLTQTMACPDCEPLARQFEEAIGVVPGWRVVPILNGMNMFGSAKGIFLGVRDTSAIPESAKALISVINSTTGGHLAPVKMDVEKGVDSELVILEPAP